MEAEKMEVDSKTVEVKVEVSESSVKMEPVIKMESVRELPPDSSNQNPDIKIEATNNDTKDIKKKEEFIINVIPKETDLAYLVVEGMVVDDEYITMTAEDVRIYLEKVVLEHIENNNPLSEMNKRAQHIHAEMRETRNEFIKLSKLIDLIERDQQKFIRTDKAARRYLTKTGGVGVDLPVLPNSLPPATSEALLKKGIVTQMPGPSITKSTLAPTRTITSTASNTQTAPQTTSGTPKDSSNNTKPTENIECIDLTDENEAANAPTAKSQPYPYMNVVKHPAPLPPKPFVLPNKNLPPVPPKPRLNGNVVAHGIVLNWNMPANTSTNSIYAPLSSFDIFGYQEVKNAPINTLLWKKIGTVKSMSLPMACTLNQFVEGFIYHFSVRAIDIHSRYGSYSDPITVPYYPKPES